MDMECQNVQRSRLTKTPKGQNRSKKWSAEETSVLLNRMVAGGRQRKGSGGGTHWSLISEELKSGRSEEECRRRFDTLLKAYKTMKEYMEKSGKSFCDIEGEERKKLKLATPLREGWYRDLERICQERKGGDAKSRKRAKRSSCDSNGRVVSVSPRGGGARPSGRCDRDRSFPRQVAIPGFSALDEELRSTLLNLVRSSYTRFESSFWVSTYWFYERKCEWLAIVQDRKASEIRRCVLQLRALKFLNIDPEEDRLVLGVEGLRVYRKFVEKVLCKNRTLDTFMEIYEKDRIVCFPEAPVSSTLQRIRVLSLSYCKELEGVDLRHFPELRSLHFYACGKLKAIRGWEVVKELGWLEVSWCCSDMDFPLVERLPSLREFYFERYSCAWPPRQVVSVVDFTQCVRLRRLEVWVDDSVALQSIDLSGLRILESMSLGFFSGLSSIQGLNGLHSLTKLELWGCKALRRVPELRCLKALTDLELSESGVEEIGGVEELHFLTDQSLSLCKSLKWLPWLGNLKALADLNVGDTGVEEIPGVELLVSLKTLNAWGSGLKWLPEPHHFSRLQRVWVAGTPLSRTDPSSFYYGNDESRGKIA